jgi:hypothetical protein
MNAKTTMIALGGVLLVIILVLVLRNEAPEPAPSAEHSSAVAAPDADADAAPQDRPTVTTEPSGSNSEAHPPASADSGASGSNSTGSSTEVAETTVDGGEAFAEFPKELQPDSMTAVADGLALWIEENDYASQGLVVGKPDCSAAPCLVPFAENPGKGLLPAFLGHAGDLVELPEPWVIVTSDGDDHMEGVLMWIPEDLPQERRVELDQQAHARAEAMGEDLGL